jgi:hypothetical protein
MIGHLAYGPLARLSESRNACVAKSTRRAGDQGRAVYVPSNAKERPASSKSWSYVIT